MVFAEYPWDIASSTSRKRLLDFLDRVARQKDSKLLSHSELLPILTKALAWKLSSQLESIKPAVRWLISIRSSSQGRTGAGVTQTLGHFMSRKARERHFQRVLALLSVDVTTITGTYLGQMLVWPFLRRSFSEVRAPWILRALNNWPGVRIMREVHALDGTLIYLDPQEYLRKTPALLKDALLIMPASFTAAALVGWCIYLGQRCRPIMVEPHKQRWKSRQHTA